MDIEIYWETNCLLNDRDIYKFNQLIHNLPDSVNHFDQLKNLLPLTSAILNIILIDDSRIKELNLTYRNLDKSTDVLTFPFENEFPNPEGPAIAEIYISQETAIRQSRDQNLTLLEELVVLVVHGFLHAFHFDHETSREDSMIMANLEKNILNFLGLNGLEPLTD